MTLGALAAVGGLVWLDAKPRAKAAKHSIASVPCCESAASVRTYTAQTFVETAKPADQGHFSQRVELVQQHKDLLK